MRYEDSEDLTHPVYDPLFKEIFPDSGPQDERYIYFPYILLEYLLIKIHHIPFQKAQDFIFIEKRMQKNTLKTFGKTFPTSFIFNAVNSKNILESIPIDFKNMSLDYWKNIFQAEKEFFETGINLYLPKKGKLLGKINKAQKEKTSKKSRKDKTHEKTREEKNSPIEMVIPDYENIDLTFNSLEELNSYNHPFTSSDIPPPTFYEGIVVYNQQLENKIYELEMDIESRVQEAIKELSEQAEFEIAQTKNELERAFKADLKKATREIKQQSKLEVLNIQKERDQLKNYIQTLYQETGSRKLQREVKDLGKEKATLENKVKWLTQHNSNLLTQIKLIYSSSVSTESRSSSFESHNSSYLHRNTSDSLLSLNTTSSGTIEEFGYETEEEDTQNYSPSSFFQTKS